MKKVALMAKKFALSLVILVLFVSPGAVAFSDALSSESQTLRIVVDLGASGSSNIFVASEDLDKHLTPEWLAFEYWVHETFPSAEGIVVSFLTEASDKRDFLLNRIQANDGPVEILMADVFVVAYDPAYVALQFGESASVAGMMLIGYNKDSLYPEMAKAAAEYLTKKVNVSPYTEGME